MSKNDFHDYGKRLIIHNKAAFYGILCTSIGLVATTGLVIGHFAYKSAHPKDVEKFVVTFDANGGKFNGSKNTATLQVEKGKKVEKTNTPKATRDEFEFVTWCTDRELQSEYNYSLPVNNSFTLYAKWDVPVTPTSKGIGYVKNSDGKSYAVYCDYPSLLPKNIKIPATHKEEGGEELPVTSVGKYDPETEINYSFEGCDSLELVEFENASNIKYIDNSAFSGCSALKTINLPDSLTYINKYAFSGCTSLSTITFKDNLLEIAEGAFSNCSSIKEIQLPENFLKLDNSAFVNCSSLEKISLGNKIMSIGDETFANCVKLTDVTIPCSTLKFGVNAFYDCRLENLRFSDIYSSWQNSEGAVIEDIETTLKAGIEIFKKEFLSNDEKFGFYYLGDKNCSVTTGKAEKLTGEITIPEKIDITTTSNDTITLNVIRIADYAFKDNKAITKVAIPSCVNFIGNYSFQMCSELNEIVFIDSSNLKSVGDFAFKSCFKLKTVNLPEGLLSLGNGSFYFSGIQEITLPKSIKEIKYTVVEEKSVTNTYAPFHGCHSLTTINVTQGGEYYTSNDGVLYSLNNGELSTLIKYPEYKGNSTVYTIKSGIEIIGLGAFYNCKKITGVVIPNSVYEISDFAFASDERESLISSVTFENDSTLAFIGVNAFANCIFTEIKLPESLITIGNRAFYNCNKIREIIIPNSVSIIGAESFYGSYTTLKVTFAGTDLKWNIYKPSGAVVEEGYDPNLDTYKTLGLLKENYYWFKQLQ